MRRRPLRWPRILPRRACCVCAVRWPGLLAWLVVVASAPHRLTIIDFAYGQAPLSIQVGYLLKVARMFREERLMSFGNTLPAILPELPLTHAMRRAWPVTWELVKRADAAFPGHRQPRLPLGGADESPLFMAPRSRRSRPLLWKCSSTDGLTGTTDGRFWSVVLSAASASGQTPHALRADVGQP